MSKQLTWDEVEVGLEIGPLQVNTSPTLSVKWAAASGDYDPIHYDRQYALKQNLPSTIVNGRLKVALLAQLMTNWIGPAGWLKSISVTHRSMDIVGDPIVCRARVTRKYAEGVRYLVECDIWTENPEGKRTSWGTAIVTLPPGKRLG